LFRHQPLELMVLAKWQGELRWPSSWHCHEQVPYEWHGVWCLM
jgi:hypothetical protein